MEKDTKVKMRALQKDICKRLKPEDKALAKELDRLISAGYEEGQKEKRKVKTRTDEVKRMDQEALDAQVADAVRQARTTLDEEGAEAMATIAQLSTQVKDDLATLGSLINIIGLSGTKILSFGHIDAKEAGHFALAMILDVVTGSEGGNRCFKYHQLYGVFFGADRSDSLCFAMFDSTEWKKLRKQNTVSLDDMLDVAKCMTNADMDRLTTLDNPAKIFRSIW